jgi:transcriptional regulator with XRE-family HTH domain
MPSGQVIAPNRIREERLAAGLSGSEVADRLGMETQYVTLFERGVVFPTPDQLRTIVAVLGVPVERLYPGNWKQAVGLEERPPAERTDISAFFDAVRGAERLLVSPDEVTWTERRPTAPGPIEVLLSLSCGTRAAPNVLLDTVFVFEALGISFVAAAGPGGCCGSPYDKTGQPRAEHNWIRSKAAHAASLGASTNVSLCPGCLTRLSPAAQSESYPLREYHVLTFFEERLRALGDRVPWKKEQQRRVVSECHAAWPATHQELGRANARLLSLIPGVEVVATYDGSDEISPCGHRTSAARSALYKETDSGAWRPAVSAEEIRERRTRLEAKFGAMGVDTVCCTHPGCQFSWSRYATDRLQVVHAVSILADALGGAHPDRFQAAARLADPEAVLQQTRAVWTAWGLSEEQARLLATDLADPRYAQGLAASCAGESCGRDLITVDVLSAVIGRGT